MLPESEDDEFIETRPLKKPVEFRQWGKNKSKIKLQPHHYRKKYPVIIHKAYQSLDELVFYIEK
jgi:hypothetical protein